MEVLRTPLYEQHKAHNARFTNFGGWEMPVQYTGILEEHHAVRNDVGVFDVSHMGEFEVRGPEAEKFLEHLVTNNIQKMQDLSVIYTFMCNPSGGVIDDFLVYKYNTEHYLLVVNAGNIVKDFNWATEQSKSFDVTVTDLTDQYGVLAVQGPKAEALVSELTDFDLSEIKAFTFRDGIKVAGVKALVSRTGYTGEDGFEIYTAAEDVEKVFVALVEKGPKYNLHLAGLGARDTLRFEANLPLYGQELDEDITPLEASLGFFVDLETDFVGADAMRRQKEEGLTRRSVGFELLGKGVARQGSTVENAEGETIGVVTTGYASPTLGKTIGVALIDSKYRKIGTDIVIRVRNRTIPARVVSKRFLSKK